MNEMDITPEESVASVFLIAEPDRGPLDVVDILLVAEEQRLLRESGISKLMVLGLTEEEARAIVGL